MSEGGSALLKGADGTQNANHRNALATAAAPKCKQCGRPVTPVRPPTPLGAGDYLYLHFTGEPLRQEAAV